jgi:hydrogenase expression/formation protein HypE
VTERIVLAHGAGGRMAQKLVAEIFVAHLDNPLLASLEDAVTFPVEGRMAFTTDSYVVHPLFFPGGDIGKLAVCGTVNDLAVSGAYPRYLSLGVILEEGLELSVLERVVKSIAATAAEAGVQIVTGDTKVVPRGAADGIFINTAGLGVVPPGVTLTSRNIKPGDAILLNGYIGDHGIAVFSKREGIAFQTNVKSDCAPLNGLVEVMLKTGASLRCMRDPTRGGLASILNELADQSGAGICVTEQSIPIRDEVLGACEMLGFDPLYVANEGKLVAVVQGDDAEMVLEAMRAHPLGRDATLIGEVVEGPPGRVSLRTFMGSTRIVDMLSGELLPRIC